MFCTTYVHCGRTPASAFAPSEPSLFFEISKDLKALLARVGYYVIIALIMTYAHCSMARDKEMTPDMSVSYVCS